MSGGGGELGSPKWAGSFEVFDQALKNTACSQFIATVLLHSVCWLRLPLGFQGMGFTNVNAAQFLYHAR